MQAQGFPIGRLFSYTIIALGNAGALAGVLYWDWSLFSVFYLYWFENVIVGVVTLVRMLMVSAAWGFGTLFGTLFRSAFFVLHYGIFCSAHGLILAEIFYDKPKMILDEPIMLLALPFMNEIPGFLWAFAGIIAVEGVYALRKIYEDRRDAALPEVIMFSPYGRIIVLHAAILLGGFAAQEMGAPVIALVFLVVLKTLYDIAVMTRTNDDKSKQGSADGVE